MKDYIAHLRGRLFILRARLFHRNISVGNGLKIYHKFRIFGKGTVRIGRNCTIDGVQGDASQYVCLDSHAAHARITIGDNVRLYAARISATYHISIDDDTVIEESGIADSDFHAIDKSRGAPTDENPEKCRIAIGKRVRIGARSFVMKGVTIGDDVSLAPGSIVTLPIRSGSFACGNPARCVSSEGVAGASMNQDVKVSEHKQ
jgi:acetyltransferase-like isoleucine patch superfamily enzyme